MCFCRIGAIFSGRIEFFKLAFHLGTLECPSGSAWWAPCIVGRTGVSRLAIYRRILRSPLAAVPLAPSGEGNSATDQKPYLELQAFDFWSSYSLSLEVTKLFWMELYHQRWNQKVSFNCFADICGRKTDQGYDPLNCPKCFSLQASYHRITLWVTILFNDTSWT